MEWVRLPEKGVCRAIATELLNTMGPTPCLPVDPEGHVDGGGLGLCMGHHRV